MNRWIFGRSFECPLAECAISSAFV